MPVTLPPLTRRPRLWGIRVQRLRHVVQVGFAAFIAWIVAQHLLIPEGGETVVPSAEAFCPLGGFATIARWIGSGGQYVPHTHASNLILAGAIVLTALVGRSFFCGWVCPFGALQEGLATVSHRLQRRFPTLKKAVRGLERRTAPVAPILDRWLRYLKYGVLAWLLAGTALYGVLVFRDIDPWIALLTVAELEVAGGLAVLGLVVVASLFVERPWCRYACPLGAIVGTIGRLSPVKIERNAAACIACDLCSRRCPAGLPVAALTRVDAPECITCLQCVGACPSQGGLDLKLVLPGLKFRSSVESSPVPATAAAALDPLFGARP